MRRIFYRGAAHLLEWEMSQAESPRRGQRGGGIFNCLQPILSIMIGGKFGACREQALRLRLVSICSFQSLLDRRLRSPTPAALARVGRISRAGKIDREVAPVRAGGEISIANPHLGRLGAQDGIAVELVAYPPIESCLRTAARVDDLFGVGSGVPGSRNTRADVRSVRAAVAEQTAASHVGAVVLRGCYQQGVNRQGGQAVHLTLGVD